MSAPDRIWLKDEEWHGKDKPPSEWFRPEAGLAATQYTRTDLAEAAQSAARAEGRREGLLEAAGIADGRAVTWEAVCMSENEGAVCPKACSWCLRRVKSTWCQATEIAHAIRDVAEVSP